MKIVVIGTRGFPNVQGGVETHCEQLYPRLALRGYQIIVFARAPYVPYKKFSYKGVDLIAIDCPQSKHMEAIIHTAKAVFKAKQLKPDVLHLQSIGPSLFAPLARILGMKVVVTHHGENYKHKKWGFFARQFLRLCETIGALSAHEIIAISDTIVVLLKNKYKRKATLIPNGVEIPHQEETMNALLRFGLEKKKYIIAVGRFVPEKGFHDLIDAFGFLNHPDWKLVIVGKADHENEYSLNLKQKARKIKNIVLTGYLSGLPLKELYSHAGLFVLPSYYEGLPIVLLEAMSYGLPCIVSDIPANKNIKLDDSHYFRTGNIKDLVKIISDSISKPFSEEKKQTQISYITEKYNWENIADETAKVYIQAMSIN